VVLDIDTIAMSLRAAHLDFGPPLTSSQMDAAQESFGLHFPPDLVALYSNLTLIGEGFLDWADQSHDNIARIRAALDWPVDGLLFDVANNDLWLPEWGHRPAEDANALVVARQYLGDVPQMIPLFSHRYLVSLPCRAGNPVLSVYQSDIIISGADLEDYFLNEFSRNGRDRKDSMDTTYAGLAADAIPFWGR